MRQFVVGLLLICIVGFGLRIGAATVWRSRIANPSGLAFGDSDGYLELGRRIANGEPYHYGWEHAAVFRSPGYPLLLSILWFGSDGGPPIWAARVLNSVLGTLLIGLIGLGGHRIGGGLVGWIAACIIAVYPGAIGMSVWVLAEAPFTLWMVLSLVLFFHAASAPTRRATILATVGGLACGVATLTRPSWLLFLPFLFAVLLFVVPWRMAVRIGLSAWIGVMIVMAPWWVRNYAEVWAFVPTTLQTGASLYDGLNENATGASDMRMIDLERRKYLNEVAGKHGIPAIRETVVYDWNDQLAPSYWKDVRAQIERIEAADRKWVFEVGFDRYLRNRALEWAGDHPRDVFRLAWIKLWRFWSPMPGSSIPMGSAGRMALAVPYLVLLGAAIAGSWMLRSNRLLLVITWSPAIYFSLLHCIFVSSIRYREPAMMLLAIPAAVCMARLAGRWSKRVARLSEA